MLLAKSRAVHRFFPLVIGLTLFACGGESARQNNARPATGGAGGGGTSGGPGATTGGSGGAPDGAPGGSGGTSSGSAGSGGALGSAGTQDGGGIGGTAGIGLGDASCKDPQPIIGIDAKETGFVSCAAGFIHRPEKRDCPSIVPRQGPIQYPPDATVECTRDQDCTKLPHGHCIVWRYPVVSTFATMCVAGCVRDAECGAGSICVCGDPVGACVSASCATDAECGEGRLCVNTGTLVAPSPAFACQSPNDTCRGPQDCTPPWMVCAPTDGGRSCVPSYGTE